MHPTRRAVLATGLAAAASSLAPARASTPHVVVVGAGPAGISAAIELAERGVRVTLVEAGAQVGGKAQGWTRRLGGDPDGALVDAGYGHHHLGQDGRHLVDLLQRFGLDGALVQAGPRDQELRQPGGQHDTLRLAKPRAGTPADGASLADWLAAADGPPARFGPLATLLARSIFMVEPDQLDAATFAASSRLDGGSGWWFRGNPQEWVWQPLADIIRGYGGVLRLSTTVSALQVQDGVVRGVRLGQPGGSLRVALSGAWSQGRDSQGMPVFVHDSPDGPRALSGRCTHAGCALVRLPAGGFSCPEDGSRFDDDGQPTTGPATTALRPLRASRDQAHAVVTLPDTTWDVAADAVVLAVDAPAFVGLAGDLLPHTRGLGACRHTVARFWLDRAVDPRSAPAALLDGTQHASSGILLHRFQERSQAWADDIARTPDASTGSVIEILAQKAVPPPAGEAPGQRETALLDAIEADLRAAWPDLAAARTRDRVLVQGQRFTHFAPGWQRHAVPVVTGVPGLYAAGDFVLLDLPCELVERAVTTGRMAANAILASHGLPQAAILGAE